MNHPQGQCLEEPINLFSQYMRLTGTPSLESPPDLPFSGKKLGVVNGSSWISLWATYFGRQMLPGIKLVKVGNEGVQLNFMRAHHDGQPCPPQINVDLICRYARDLFDLVHVDAVLISCSTMNRAYAEVKVHLAPMSVPVVQIDEAMMEEAVKSRGRILVIATHGPTVKSTKSLLQETAVRLGQPVEFTGATVEEAFELLGEGRIADHNRIIADKIRGVQKREKVDLVVLALLSMSVFAFSHPDSLKDFGVPVLNSGETGFRRVGEVLNSIR